MRCMICDSAATGRLSVDLDIDGLGFCDTHKDDVYTYYLFLCLEGERAANRYKMSCKLKLNKDEKN